ncbi:TPA: YjbF family lipoprotein [Vibrio alginolyticus]|uniref:YjbF family lipoprotein n=1 Tax=Vibrio alginolyticus TaxID=663 RepID=UPI001BD2AA31|nr:YjbF family lipoprotein [Vibrio alginolyticus]ELB2789216.1 YjbF family lipoprotein [Vibrio alginolyticus]MBS9905791.1 YjbF family lipoprotein [Vibrio alginolyticus]MBS9933723.1 YjbF family lipoprotein [Vibrio alginolyticus]MBS9983832.1 YjbF family lipoprotein [Vibrio alginolyticus]MBT0057548.1 YjbF family lipoprotein [Vibrio alginolyticus]
MNIFRTSKWIQPLLALPLLGLLFGCTQKFNDVSATVQEAYSNYIDVEMTTEEINAVPYASAYLKLGNQKQVFVVLAFAEQNPLNGKIRLKWVSADKAMIVTENGHIVKTIGLQNGDLAGMYGDVPDFSSDSASVNFALSYDWATQYRYGFPVNVTRSYSGQETLITPISNAMTDVYKEVVEFSSLSQSVENYYWVNEQGQVVKTLQYLGPNMIPVELTILKGYSKS